MNIGKSDLGYRIKVYSDIRLNVGLRSLQSDIGGSDIADYEYRTKFTPVQKTLKSLGLGSEL
jgi:hypothetical protein